MKQKQLDQMVEVFHNLSTKDAGKVLTYAKSLAEIDHEALDTKEANAVQALGYNPTTHIPDWEWQAQLKRAKLAEQRDERNRKLKEK